MDNIVIFYTHYTEAVKIIEDNFNVIEVISNNPEDQFADIIISSNLEDKIEHEKEIVEYLKTLNPDLIILSNYTRLIKHKLLESYQGKIINIHDSLLPKHEGLNAIIKTWESEDKYAGFTLHLVEKEMDKGEILAQSKFKINRQLDFSNFLQDYLKHYQNYLVNSLTKVLETLNLKNK